MSDPADLRLITDIMQTHEQELECRIYEAIRSSDTYKKGGHSFRIEEVIIEARYDEWGNGFTTQNGCLTPLGTFRRKEMIKRYRAELDEKYADLGENSSETSGSRSVIKNRIKVGHHKFVSLN
eukprot:UN15327